MSSITDETTRTQLAEILVKKEMKKKSGMSSQGMSSSGGMPQPTSMGAGPMGGMSGAAGPSPVIYSGQPTGPNVQPSGRPLFPSGGPQIQDSYQGLLNFFTKVNIF